MSVELEVPLPPKIWEMGVRNVGDTLRLAMEWKPSEPVLVVFDRQSPLARVLADLYGQVSADARTLCFDEVEPSAIFSAFDALSPGQLVVLIQSTSFRLEAFRLRVELFRRGLKVVEHPHLARMVGPHLIRYLESLAYDPARLRPLGRFLQAAVGAASRSLVVSRGGYALRCHGPLEPASLNVGDYAATKNTGGQFPIGEVFTEAVDLQAVEGRLSLFAFADRDFTLALPDRPIVLAVREGQVIGAENATPAFDAVLEQIRQDEGTVWLREWGFGLNRAFAPDRIVPDVGTFERMNGLHFSLGAKHAVYPKPGFRRRDGRHHVDIFVEAERIVLGDTTVYADGDWIEPADPSGSGCQDPKV